MKRIVITLIILIAGSVWVVYSYHPPKQKEIVVLKDVTDSIRSSPDVNEIVSLFDFTGDHKWNGAEFRFSTVSDVSLSKTSELKLEPENKWLSNEMQRDKKIQQFQKYIEESINSNTKVIGRNNSSVYAAIAYELNRIKRDEAGSKILLVYSDLMENTPDLSFYNDQIISKLIKQDDSIKQILNEISELSSLKGIEVRLVYEPANIEADRKFRIVSGFYKKLLEAKGATVSISANLD